MSSRSRSVDAPPSQQSSSSTTTTQSGARSKSWIIRVLVMLGICIMCVLLRVLSINKGMILFEHINAGGGDVQSLDLVVKAPASIQPKERTKQTVPPDNFGVEKEETASGSTLASIDGKQQQKKRTTVDHYEMRPLESGLYRPNTTRALEHYAGAWLAPKRRFLEAKARIKQIKSLEGASFSVTGYSSKQDHRIALMTRDYFDFAVQHLSSTTNQLPQFTTREFLDELLAQTVDWVDVLQARAEVEPTHAAHITPLLPDVRRTQKTVALIPFCNRPASVESSRESQEVNDFQVKVRLLFFRATFWSVFRAFPKIIVTVATIEDLKTLEGMHLPIWRTIDMTSIFDPAAPIRTKGSVHFLPKESLLFLTEKLTDKKATRFQEFEYIYYTEADHVLQIRSTHQMYDSIDASLGRYAVAPHRMQTIVMPRLFPEFKAAWKNSRYNGHLLKQLEHVRIITEHEDPLGSCCDDGRFTFADCKNWWYNCKEWGLRNYTDWIRFGQHGFTQPTGSEHAARCRYSEFKQLCPAPKNCAKRVPFKDSEVCGEME